MKKELDFIPVSALFLRHPFSIASHPGKSITRDEQKEDRSDSEGGEPPQGQLKKGRKPSTPKTKTQSQSHLLLRRQLEDGNRGLAVPAVVAACWRRELRGKDEKTSERQRSWISIDRRSSLSSRRRRRRRLHLVQSSRSFSLLITTLSPCLYADGVKSAMRPMRSPLEKGA